MGGMRMTPKGVHRERPEGEPMPPVWWVVWQGQPHAEGSYILGRTERLERPRWHRAYPETGGWPETIRTWVAAVEYLVAAHKEYKEREEEQSAGTAQAQGGTG